MKIIHPGHLEHRFCIFGCQILCITDLAIMPLLCSYCKRMGFLAAPPEPLPSVNILWESSSRLLLLCQSHVISHTICGQRSSVSITQRPRFFVTQRLLYGLAVFSKTRFWICHCLCSLDSFWRRNCQALDNCRGSVKRWFGRWRWPSKETRGLW